MAHGQVMSFTQAQLMKTSRALLLAISPFLSPSTFAHPTDHGTPEVAPVINSHALAESRDGHIYLVTDHPANAFLVFKKDGTFVRSFGKGLIGGHGLEFFEREGEEYLIHVDCGWHFKAEGWNAKPNTGRVTILKPDGTIVRKLPTPMEIEGLENPPKKSMPCDVAVTPEGTILIADGYGSDRIYEMTFEGKLVRQ